MISIKRNPFNLTILIIVATIVVGIGASIASSAVEKDVTIQLSGSLQRDGKTISLDPSVIANSNEVITYDIKSTNTGLPVNNLRVVGQIPAGTALVKESADNQNAKVVYSLDGQTFSADPQIQIVDDGQRKMVSAPVSSYRAVAFNLNDGFQGQSDLHYQVKVK